MLTLSRDEVRRIDKLAIEKLGIPGVVLMENAGRSAASVVLRLLHEEMKLDPEKSTVAIFCGGGNNGGDGYVIARQLVNAGINIRIYAAVDRSKLIGDAAVNSIIAERMKLPARELLTAQQIDAAIPELETCNVFVDALLGTGFNGLVRPELAAVIELCNRLAPAGSRRKVVAIDVPSGLDCDTGQPSNAVIRADVTVTFVAVKRGFLNPASRQYTGAMVVASIGAPAELLCALLHQ
jgi:NAD(P)H-hydrate epimerase